MKSQLKIALEENPDLLKNRIVHIQDKRGRPRLEDDQPDLLETIKTIAMFGASAEERRRSEALRSCKTLPYLFAEMKSLGFQISETSLYYRFLLKNCKTNSN